MIEKFVNSLQSFINKNIRLGDQLLITILKKVCVQNAVPNAVFSRNTSYFSL